MRTGEVLLGDEYELGLGVGHVPVDLWGGGGGEVGRGDGRRDSQVGCSAAQR